MNSDYESFSVGGWYRDGRDFGREFRDFAEAQGYFEHMKAAPLVASISFFGVEPHSGETVEIEAYAKEEPNDWDALPPCGLQHP